MRHVHSFVANACRTSGLESATIAHIPKGIPSMKPGEHIGDADLLGARFRSSVRIVSHMRKSVGLSLAQDLRHKTFLSRDRLAASLA